MTPHRLALGAILAVLAVSLCARAEASPPVLSGVDVKKVNGNAISGSAVPVDGSAHTQPVSAVSLPLPTGAATAAKQDTANTSLAAIADALAGTIAVSGSLSVAGGLTDTELRASAVPVSLASAPLPSGASTSAKQDTGNTSLSSIDGKIVLPSALDGSGYLKTHEQGTATVSGTVTANAGTGTFAISAASLPLPSGAATSAKQPALGTAGTPSSDVLTVQGATSMTALKVDGSAVTQPVSGTFWQATQPVSAASLPLPSGAATASNQTTANTSLASIDGKLPSALVSGRLDVNIGAGSVTVGSGSLNVGTVTTITNTVPVKNTATRTATTPTQVSVLTSATQVFTSTAGICSVTVVNEGSNGVTCGQTNAVTDLAIGLPLNPIPTGSNAVVGGAVTFGIGSPYGGDVYCIAHTSSTNVGVQPTACP
jgi:hypothetical protein